MVHMSSILFGETVGTQYRVRLYPPFGYSILYKEYDLTGFNHLKKGYSYGEGFRPGPEDEEPILGIQGLGLGFRLRGLGFRGSDFSLWGLGFRVQVLGFRLWGL